MMMIISIASVILVTFILPSIVTAVHVVVEDVCYDTPLSRKQVLQGSWQKMCTDDYDGSSSDDVNPSPYLYFNLSCSVEWSKYSCIHQGAKEHAHEAADTQFYPNDCTFREFNAQQFVASLQGRRVTFVGDSLLRQVLIALTCALEVGGVVTSINADWPICGEKEWFCHGTKECISCGRHSGFNSLSVMLHGGGELYYALDQIKAADDLLVLESGVHGKDHDVIMELINSLVATYRDGSLKDLSNVIWMITWSPQFQTDDGAYDKTILEEAKKKGIPIGCSRESMEYPKRPSLEMQLLKNTMVFGDTSLFDMIYGVLWLEGTNSLGHLKIGGGVGSYGDCQHFCMPGPPDYFALAAYTMLMKRLTDTSPLAPEHTSL